LLKAIYLISILLHVVLLVDTYVYQIEDNKEKIASITSFHRHLNRAPFITTEINTSSGLKFLLPEGNLSLSDTSQLVIMRGLITKYPVDVILKSGDLKETYPTSFLKRTTGGILISMITILLFVVTTVLFIIRKRVPKEPLYAFLFFLFYCLYETVF
jgi:hypothetical protein